MLLPTEHVQWLTEMDKAIDGVLKERRANLPKGRKHVFINWCRRMEALIYNAEGEEFYGLNPIIQDEADFNLVKNRLDELRVTLTKPDAVSLTPLFVFRLQIKLKAADLADCSLSSLLPTRDKPDPIDLKVTKPHGTAQTQRLCSSPSTKQLVFVKLFSINTRLARDTK